MRKTSPILLPEQNNEFTDSHVLQPSDSLLPSMNDPEYDSQQQQQVLASLSAQQDQHHDYDQQHQHQHQLQHTNPFLIDDEFFPIERNDDVREPNTSSEAIQSTSMSFNELPTTDSNSLNTDFLNNYLMTQQQQQQPHEHEQPDTLTLNANENQLNVNLLENEVTNEMARPRQMGRRAEIRPRIVSITAECCAEGNQVFSILFFFL